MIVQNAYKRNVNRTIKTEDWGKVCDQTGAMKYHLLNEGNNCQFLSKKLTNFMIRWDKKFDKQNHTLADPHGPIKYEKPPEGKKVNK